MAYFPSYRTSATSLINPYASLNSIKTPHLPFRSFLAPKLFTNKTNISTNGRLHRNSFFLQCTKLSVASETDSSSDYEYSDDEDGPLATGQTPPPVKRRRSRYRKQYPGEVNGITEEMRFVAMKLRNNGKSKSRSRDSDVGGEGRDMDIESGREETNDGESQTWQPTVEGLLKYLVDTKLVFTTVERIVDESTDVSYVYFRRTGLERSECISRDLEWLKELGNEIPEPSNPGETYVRYLEELAEKSPPLFLSHFYNIYFSHIAGGQVIARKVSDVLFEGRELEINRWDGDAEELLRGVREKLNALGEHWSRDEKNRCLRETTKAFRFLGQIVRLIII